MLDSLFNKFADLQPEVKDTIVDFFFNEFVQNIYFKNIFYRTPLGRLLLIFRKLDILTFSSKQIFSLDQYYWHDIFDHDLMSRNNPQNVEPVLMFSGLAFCSCVEQILA